MKVPLGGSCPIRSATIATAPLVCLLFNAPASPLLAVEVDWTNRLVLEERYDDNITELSSKDLDRLGRSGGGDGEPCGSGSTDPGGHRFSITTPDDLISIPQLSSTLRAGWLARRPTILDFDLSAYQYARNPVKNYQSYRLSLTQPLNRSKAHSTSIQLSYGILPGFYLRNLRSDRTSQEFADMGISVLPPPRREATFRKGTTQLEIDQEIVADRLWLRGTLGDERRNFNRCFDERDSRMPYHEAELTWSPWANSQWRFRTAYRREHLRAHGDLGVTPAFSEPDISSGRNILAGSVRFGWKTGRRLRSVGLQLETEHRDYDAGDPNDLFHFGRSDRRRRLTLTAQIPLRKGWLLSAEAERETNRSSLPSNLPIEPDETTNYTHNLVQIGFGYDFQARRRAAAPEAP